MYENKKGNNKQKENNQIGEKQGFCQQVAKYGNENQANILTRNSARSSSVLKKNKKMEKKKTTKSNLLKWTLQEESSPLVEFTWEG